MVIGFRMCLKRKSYQANAFYCKIRLFNLAMTSFVGSASPPQNAAMNQDGGNISNFKVL